MKTLLFVATFCVALSYGINVAKSIGQEEQKRNAQMVAMIDGGER